MWKFSHAEINCHKWFYSPDNHNTQIRNQLIQLVDQKPENKSKWSNQWRNIPENIEGIALVRQIIDSLSQQPKINLWPKYIPQETSKRQVAISNNIFELD